MGLAWCWPNRGVRTCNHEGELSKAPDLLASLPICGRVVTGDALYCQFELCGQIDKAGGYYLVIVKKNQKTLYEDVEYLFAEPPPGEKFAMVEDQGRHGNRREARKLWASTALMDYLIWPRVRQVKVA
jgi:hypothetical protein